MFVPDSIHENYYQIIVLYRRKMPAFSKARHFLVPLGGKVGTVGGSFFERLRMPAPPSGNLDWPAGMPLRLVSDAARP